MTIVRIFERCSIAGELKLRYRSKKEHKKKNFSEDKTVFWKKYFIRGKTLGLGPFNNHPTWQKVNCKYKTVKTVYWESVSLYDWQLCLLQSLSNPNTAKNLEILPRSDQTLHTAIKHKRGGERYVLLQNNQWTADNWNRESVCITKLL